MQHDITRKTTLRSLVEYMIAWPSRGRAPLVHGHSTCHPRAVPRRQSPLHMHLFSTQQVQAADLTRLVVIHQRSSREFNVWSADTSGFQQGQRKRTIIREGIGEPLVVDDVHQRPLAMDH